MRWHHFSKNSAASSSSSSSSSPPLRRGFVASPIQSASSSRLRRGFINSDIELALNGFELNCERDIEIEQCVCGSKRSFFEELAASSSSPQSPSLPRFRRGFVAVSNERVNFVAIAPARSF